MYTKSITVFLLTVIISVPALSDPFTVLTDIDPPAQYYDADGQLTGFGVELFRAIQKEVGNDDDIVVVPWARAYSMIQSETNVVLFLMARNEQRNKQYQWIGPVLEFTFGLYGKAESDLTIDTIEDAKKVTSIGVYTDDVRDQLLTAMGFENLKRVTYNIQNVKMLMNDRIDLYAASSISYDVDAREAGYRASDLRLLYSFHTIQAYIAMSADIPRETVDKWNQALDTIIAKGRYEEILKKYYPTANLPGPAITSFANE